MRVLHVTPYVGIEPVFGGIPPAVQALTQGLVVAGCEVIVLTSDWGTPRPLTGVEIWTVRSRLAPIGRLLNTPITPGVLGISQEDLRDIDVVHMHGIWTLQNVIMLKHARSLGIPYVLQAHGSLGSLRARSTEKRLFLWIVGRRLIRGAGGLIALSKSEVDDYLGFGVPNQKVRIIPNPLIFPSFLGDANSRQPPATRAQDEKLHIGFLGRLHESKRISRLLEATKQLSEDGYSVRCQIAGPDGGDVANLRRLVDELGLHDRVDFLGVLGDSQKWEFIRELHALVLPAFRGFPITILEAFAARTPVVVTTDADWIGDSISSAICVSGQQGDDLARSIERVTLDHRYRERLVSEGFALVTTQFSPESIAGRLVDLYQGLQASRHKGT